MLIENRKIAAPDSDKRWKIVEATMRKQGYSPTALIETLHTIQESFGYISDEGLKFAADSLNVAPSKAYGVATFYNLFNMIPLGEHVFSLCTGTACYVKGAGEVLEFMKTEYGLEPGETTPDNKLSFVEARCVGCCGLAPVMILDGTIVGKLSPDQMKQRIQEWMSHDK